MNLWVISHYILPKSEYFWWFYRQSASTPHIAIAFRVFYWLFAAPAIWPDAEAASIIAGLGEKGIQGEEMKVLASTGKFTGKPHDLHGKIHDFR